MDLKRFIQIAQIVGIAFVFLLVFSVLILNLKNDLKANAEKRKVVKIKIDPEKRAFIKNIDTHYQQVLEYYRADEFEEALAGIQTFEKYGRSNYKKLVEIKSKIPRRYKDKLVKVKDYIGELEYESDFNIVVAIKQPLYGQLYFLTDFPADFIATAKSVDEDFSNAITWSSSIDGDLGKGGNISVTLSKGKHDITALCTDGLKDYTMNIVVEVEEPPPQS